MLPWYSWLYLVHHQVVVFLFILFTFLLFWYLGGIASTIYSYEILGLFLFIVFFPFGNIENLYIF